MRPRTRLVLALLTIVPLTPVTLVVPARADAATCQGVPATIVGHAGQDEIHGTSGADVIVSAGVFDVHAGAGNDLVCITDGPAGETGNVYAGKGDDRVYSDQGADGYVFVSLGDGADSFVGGSGAESVQTGGHAGHDDAVDTVATGAGNDIVVTGDRTAASADRINTGPGDDEVALYARRLTSHATLALGGGFDELDLPWSKRRDGKWLFDNRRQRATRDGVVRLRWTSVEAFELPDTGPNAVSFRGNRHREMVWAMSIGHVSLGGGNDYFAHGWSVRSSRLGTVNGGRGRDEVALEEAAAGVVLDLAAGTARFDNVEHGQQLDVSGFEDARVAPGRHPVTVRGTSSRNVIEVAGCDATVEGRGGADQLIAVETGTCDFASSAILRGGPGPDQLFGGTGNDVLIGGAGRDRADGGPGRDACSAEVRRSCERRP